MKTVYSEQHRLRAAKSELHGGKLVTPYERPERADAILSEIKGRNWSEVINAQDFGLAPALSVHSEQYVEFLSTAWIEWVKSGVTGEALPTVWPARTLREDRIPQHIDGKLGYFAFAGETAISEGTWEAALAAMNVALTAADQILAGDCAAFALCRPPGHHAAIDQFGGYCFLNNAAIAAQYLHNAGAGRIAILDVDFHHGNGTQQIFYDRSDVQTLSLHGDPDHCFPHFLGYADEKGAGSGEGYNVNYPLPPGTEYANWLVALEDAFERIQAFEPEVLVVPLGVDTFELDPISSFKLKTADFADYGRRLGALGLQTLFVMEGGYALKEIGLNTVGVLDGFRQAAAD